MSRYTVNGSEALDARIDRDLKLIAEKVEPQSIAGILLGGYGRGEGTPFIDSDGSQLPFNDYDLVIIVDRVDRDIRQRFREMEQTLSKETGLPVDLTPYAADRLSACEFSLLNYEMKYGHKVLWGNPDTLEALPAYAHAEIPLTEGSRLLLNRGKLLLDIKLRLAGDKGLAEKERIRFLKFIYKTWLAMGDCALLGARKYDLSYAVKRDRITAIQEIPHQSDIIEKYLEAIALKEWGDYPARIGQVDIDAAFRDVCSVYLDFFPWYCNRHPARESSLIKAMLLNLKWNGRPLLHHPRKYLYLAIQELLKENPNEYRLREMLFCREGFTDRFYAMQARFS